MDDALEQALVQDYPQIFQDWNGDPAETCMAWGIAVGNGWHDLIRKLCEDIMAVDPDTNFKAEQVKEKFGGLRFYYSGGNEEIGRLVDVAEEESYKTCEGCGTKENVTVEGSWVQTLCASCRNK